MALLYQEWGRPGRASAEIEDICSTATGGNVSSPEIVWQSMSRPRGALLRGAYALRLDELLSLTDRSRHARIAPHEKIEDRPIFGPSPSAAGRLQEGLFRQLPGRRAAGPGPDRIEGAGL